MNWEDYLNERHYIRINRHVGTDGNHPANGLRCRKVNNPKAGVSGGGVKGVARVALLDKAMYGGKE